MISEIAQRLWDLNENKLVRNVDYRLDLQETFKRNNNQGKRPLVSINVKQLLNRPTFKNKTILIAFLSLLNNYEPETDEPEYETAEEDNEQKRFLAACMQTPLMKEAHRFLAEQGKAPEDEQEFKNMLEDIWFEFYSRTPDESIESSSAFEHVFVGESKGHKKVLGCHNMLDYYYLQRKGLVSYLGYISSGTIYNDIETDDPGIVAFAFKMNGVLKPMGGFLVGLSPEFEIALYTIIFLCGSQKTKVSFSNIEVEFECFKMKREGRTVMGTLFPSVQSESETFND